MKETNPWYTMSVEGALNLLGSTKEGLSRQTAEERLKQYGPNELKAGKRTTPWMILFEQFKNIFVIILLLAAGISALMHHGVEAIVIAVIVLFSVLLGFVQEHYRSLLATVDELVHVTIEVHQCHGTPCFPVKESPSAELTGR